MLTQQIVCLRRLGGDRATEVKFGRWIRNDNVRIEELIDHATAKVEELARGLHVLAIQDTTELNYQAHAERVDGLGSVGNGTDVGLFLHPMLALDAASGACLGLAAIHPWTRRHVAADHYARLPIEEKESYRWLKSAETAKQRLHHATMITIIADRESDIYEEWARLPDAQTHLLTRVCRDRRLNNGEKLYAHSDTLPVVATPVMEIAARPGKRSAHRAQMEIRFGRVLIQRPAKKPVQGLPSEIALTLVDVRETASSRVPGEPPIHWRLLTTHAVTTGEQALEIIDWYRQRWQIEQLFRTLKRQGLNIESSQLEGAPGLTKLAVLALQVAVKSLQLTRARDGTDARLATDAFEPEELTVLTALQPKLEGKTAKQKNPHGQGQLAWAAWIIARLGGWKGYASESPPGPITMLRGMQQFASLRSGWALAEMCA